MRARNSENFLAINFSFVLQLQQMVVIQGVSNRAGFSNLELLQTGSGSTVLRVSRQS
jgi:hypothetical protein